MSVLAKHESPVFGLLGRTLAHSWSARIHAALGSTPYKLFEREPEQVGEFLTHGDWQGLNVTIPYKQTVLDLASQKSERVERLGAANTLVRLANDEILADNTDVLGFAFMLEQFALRHFDTSPQKLLQGKKVLVLGSGGACKAVKAALEDAHANVVIISRSGTETYKTISSRHRDAVLIVNTTPVGMYPNCPATPLDEGTLQSLTNLLGILDVVYNPERTGLCMAAERMGIPSASGLTMLVSQAFYSSQLFQGSELDNGLVQQIEDDLRTSMRNIILIGMPGSGKTSAGCRLARLAHRPFADLDKVFEVEHGITPADYIRKNGEAAFRDLETRLVFDQAKRSGLVIACGGGVVTRPENYSALHQNSTIVMLDRPLSELNSAGRPLSQSKGIQQLADERMDLYKSWADIVFTCTGSASGDANILRNMLKLV